MMWKIVGLLAVVVMGVYVGGSVTWEQSTHAGPFAYFQKKYPGLDGQPLLNAANRDIEEFAQKQKSLDAIAEYMENMGFTTDKLINPNSFRSDISPDIKTYAIFEYVYGVFWWSHRWNFGIFVKSDASIEVLQSFQVCIRCP